MTTKTWTVTTPDGSAAPRTLTHDEMRIALFEAVHGVGFTLPAAAASEPAASREPEYAAV